MTEKNGAFRLSDMPRIKHPLRFTGIMTCELLMVYEAVCHPRFANGIDVYRHADYADRSRLFLVPCARPYAYHKDVIGRLIGEVYANVSRHAPSGGKYEVSVLVKTIPWKSLK